MKKNSKKFSKNCRRVTALITVNAAGESLTTLVILSRKTIPKEIDKETEFRKFEFDYSKTSFITLKIFENFILNHIMPAIQNSKKNQRALIILDGHSSRKNKTLLSKLYENEIDVLCLPSHSSHFLQPLDVTVNSVFQTQRAKLTNSSDWLEIMKSTKKSLYFATYEETIKSGFSRTGIYPFDDKKILQDETILKTLNTSDIIDNSQTNSLSGKILTSTEFLNNL